MNLEKKIIFFDVDDTLVHHRGDKSYIPDSTISTLKRLKDEGHVLAIASGRGYEHIQKIMSLLNINHGVCFNGHMVVIDYEVKVKQPLHKEDMVKLLNYLNKSIFPYIVLDEVNGYLKDFFGRVKSTLKKEIKEVEGLEGDMYLDRLKPYRKAEPPYYGMMFFKKKFSYKAQYPNLTFKDWGGIGYEVANKGVSKLSGIHWMADYFKIDHDQIVVFGDNYNDLEMLEGAKVSVAMGNAVEAAKEMATYVTDHVGDEGIEKACYHLGLLEEKIV